MKKTAKKNATSVKEVNNVNNLQAAQVETIEAVEVVEAVEVDGAEKCDTHTISVTPYPAVVQAYPDKKVSAKDACQSAVALKSRIQAERRGANATIRLIGDAAANGDTNALNVLCALCDIPTNCLYLLTVEKVRAAVNEWYPYYVEDNNRKISVRARGVWYTDARDNEALEDAQKRVTRGYVVTPVDDYLEQLIAAAKCRAKGIKPRRVDAAAVHSDDKLSTATTGITAAEIDEAKQRRVYSPTAANVWKKDRNGFYI